MKKNQTLSQITRVYTFIFLIWACYRYLFRFPVEIEEIIFKPVIWLGPVFYLLYKNKESLSSIGWSAKNLFKSLYLGIGLGIIFAVEGLIANNLKYGDLNLVSLPFQTSDLLVSALLLSLITALSEETVFRGLIFNRLAKIWNNELAANLFSTIGWALIHLPSAIFNLHYDFAQLVIYFFLIFIFGFASCLVYGRTGTIVAPVLLHVFWSWPINLFR